MRRNGLKLLLGLMVVVGINTVPNLQVGGANGQRKVVICLRGQTKVIAETALDSNLQNGATLGPCVVSPCR